MLSAPAESAEPLPSALLLARYTTSGCALESLRIGNSALASLLQRRHRLSHGAPTID